MCAVYNIVLKCTLYGLERKAKLLSYKLILSVMLNQNLNHQNVPSIYKLNMMAGSNFYWEYSNVGVNLKIVMPHSHYMQYTMLLEVLINVGTISNDA